MNFRNLACDHLAQYKVNVLGLQEDGKFRYRGQDIAKAHILPLVDSKSHELNILAGYRNQFFASDYTNIKLHQFFHHLNSSQALCINLFYPLIAENILTLFLKYLDIEPATDINAIFEKESNLENAARRTSFDFYVQHADACEIYVEVKYAEDGFARAKKDVEHREKFQKTYLPLVKASPFLSTACRDENFFLNHYQVLRNLVHISDMSHVVLLFPSANTVVAKEAVYAKSNLLTEAGNAKLKIVFLEEFVSFLEKACNGSSLEGYYSAFRAKYLPSQKVQGSLSIG